MEQIPINLTLDFAKSTVAQTGDFTAVMFIMLIAFALVAIFFLTGKKIIAGNNAKHIEFTEKSIAKHSNKQSLFLGNFKIISGFIAVSLFVILLVIGFVIAQHSYAANQEQTLVADSNKITATVSDDGQISISDCNIKNASITKYTALDSISVSLSSEVKSIEALNNTKILINAFNETIYNDIANGDVHDVSGMNVLSAGDSAKLTFSFENLDKNTALSLCGKSVFEIELAWTAHSLEPYTWAEIQTIADDLSKNETSSKYYTEFVNYAKYGVTKPVELSNGDILYMRIIGICHDEKADGSGKKAGLTFMGQNSINQGYYTGDKGSTESSYACGWAGDGTFTTTSPLRDKMQLGGEIYNLIQPGLGITPTQVKKFSRGGWTGAAEGLYVGNIRVSHDYFFLPSGIELGTKRFGDDEGREYEYNKNDALPERWRFSDVCSAGILVNLNHKGYAWLMENKDNYSTSDDAWKAVPEEGKVPCNGPRACWERSVANGSILRVTEWDLVGNLHYQGVPFGDYWGGINQTACICPCFCL